MRDFIRVSIAPLALALVCLAGSSQGAALEAKHGEFTASDGVKIHYLEAGQGSPVVLIHGYTGTAEGNWFSNGVAEALAKNHRVVAIDCRGHGKSEKPTDPAKYGPQMARDVLELMDHLQIGKAHVHGYSMGGFIVTQLLTMQPERFLTASYGGSGVPEVDDKYKSEVPKDEPGPDPQEAEASGKLRTNPDRDEAALAAVRQYPWKEGERGRIDLTKIQIPVLAINGQFDGPNAKTHRMQRELANFTAVVLPGKSHLTAIMAGYIPQLYIEALARFINDNDRTSTAITAVTARMDEGVCNMSEVHRIAKQLQRTFQGRAFHGPAVEEALDGVTAKMAAARSPGGAHNIWQIVLHVTLWQETLARWLQGDLRRPSDEEDWPKLKDKSEAAWQEAHRRLRSSNDALRDVVMALDEARLEQPLGDGMTKAYVALHGIIQHNIYHAGQISMLKKMHS